MANRRSVLIGLGSLVAGGGALLGTGAFTSVEAERTVSVQTTGDANALLGLSPAEIDGDGGNPYVTDGTDDNTISIDLDGNDEGATGLNQNAITTFDELVQIANNGTEDVGTLSFEIDADSDSNQGVLSVVYDGSPVSDTNTDDGIYTTGNVLSDNDLGVGDTETFGLEVDLLDDDNPSQLSSSASFTLTISAEAVDDS